LAIQARPVEGFEVLHGDDVGGGVEDELTMPAGEGEVRDGDVVVLRGGTADRGLRVGEEVEGVTSARTADNVDVNRTSR
jgi:hypothetical protein